MNDSRRASRAGCLSALAFVTACSASFQDPAPDNATESGGASGASSATSSNGGSRAGTTSSALGGSAATAGANTTSTAGGATTTGGANNSASSAGTSQSSSSFHCTPGSIDPGPAPLLRLSQTQYLNSVHDLLGDVKGLDSAVGAPAAPSVFGLQQADVAQVELEQYQTAANTIAAAVVADSTRLSKLVPCSAGNSKRDCAANFVRNFGALAYRAPLIDTDDVDAHLALYDVGAKVSHEHGIELVLRGILQSPRFLYRVELGSGDPVSASAVKLSGPELAARLSFALWDTVPDSELTRAANAGELANTDGLAKQLSRMLADSRGNTLVRRFLEGWIHLSDLNTKIKDTNAFPDWTDDTRQALTGQAHAFFDDVLKNQSGSFEALLTSPQVFANQALAAYYPGASGSKFSVMNANSGATAGLLTLPALLAIQAKPAESSPIYRGKFVREELLCQELPSPPANVPKPPDVKPGVSTRERLSQHETDPACSGCHNLMDPIGFGFENYDAIGRYRTADGGAPVSASGTISETGEIDGDFDGTVELARRLSQSVRVKECVTRQFFRFLLDRYEQSVDDCSMQSVLDAFLASGANLNQLPQALVNSDAFLYRRPQ